jgi:hypothetical protein
MKFDEIIPHLENLSARELLLLGRRINAVLSDRKISRSSNNPVSDYAELLIAKALNLDLAPRATKGYDAIDKETGEKYEIKCRWLSRSNTSRQLSAIRDLVGAHFDFLVAVVLDPDCTVKMAVKVPHASVKGRFSKHTNSHIVFADAKLLAADKAEDITRKVAKAAADLG